MIVRIDTNICYCNVFLIECKGLGGQSGAAVTSLHGNHQDVGSNPATARNERTHNGQTPAQKVPQ